MANVFLSGNEQRSAIATGDNIFGAGGDESAIVPDGITGVEINAKVERLDSPALLGDHTFQVTSEGFEISVGGNVVAAVPSVPSDGLDLRAADGNVTVTQTGVEQFTLANPDDGNDSADVGTSPVSGGDIGIQPGGDVSESPGAADVVLTETLTLGASDDAATIDASGADTTFNVESGNFTVAIENFEQGDALEFFDTPDVQNTDASDGVIDIVATNSADGEVATVQLTGLDSSVDGSVFDAATFTDQFGADALM